MSFTVYVKRDGNNKIIAIAKEKTDDSFSAIENNNPEVIEFLEKQNLFTTNTDLQHALAKSDVEMIRVVEDLIEVLIQKQYIAFTDLPEVAQQKILKRKNIRNMLRDVT